MTREEAITYGERKKARIQEKLCRDGSSYGDYSIYYSEMEFTSAALSALREQEERRWITVTERLPENIANRVLVVCERSNGVFYAHYEKPFWINLETDKPFISTVTHWMPLPEPPKGE